MISIIPAKRTRAVRKPRAPHSDTDIAYHFPARDERPRLVTEFDAIRVPIDEQVEILAGMSDVVLSLYATAAHRDMAYELSCSRERFVGEETFSVYGLPKYLRTCIDRLRRRVVSPSAAPSVSVTVGCLISYGLDTLSRSEYYARLIELKQKFDDVEGDDGTGLDELSRYFNDFEMTIVDMAGTGACSHCAKFTPAERTRHDRICPGRR